MQHTKSVLAAAASVRRRKVLEARALSGVEGAGSLLVLLEDSRHRPGRRRLVVQLHRSDLPHSIPVQPAAGLLRIAGAGHVAIRRRSFALGAVADAAEAGVSRLVCEVLEPERAVGGVGPRAQHVARLPVLSGAPSQTNSHRTDEKKRQAHGVIGPVKQGKLPSALLHPPFCAAAALSFFERRRKGSGCTYDHIRKVTHAGRGMVFEAPDKVRLGHGRGRRRHGGCGRRLPAARVARGWTIRRRMARAHLSVL